tara:strand:+ start:354 stop:689 length:336 start_codon:yes stop_codon:yes gene_type:complete
MAIDEKPVVEDFTTEDGQQLSPEELKERRGKITEYYQEHIPSLKVQLEYEGLLRDIEKVRAERLQAQMFVQNTMTQQQQNNAVPPVPAKPAAPAAKTEEKRTLKKTAKANA